MTKEEWLEHAKACFEGGRSKASYAKQHDLIYHKLLYWVDRYKKLHTNQFVPAVVKSGSPSDSLGSLGVVEFTNGSRLVIQHPDLVPLLSGLLV